MAVSSGYQSFVVERLAPVGQITAKHMFGGVGLYADGLFFALMHDDRLYFKVGDANRSDFEAAGMEPFRPYGDDRAMAYWEVPVDVLEDHDRLPAWALKALGVAATAKRRKK
jgi:DNA transformation protein